jgi:hypothetical protein
MTRVVYIIVVKVCAVVAQTGHTMELQSLQLELERGLWIVDSPAVIFDVDDLISVRVRSMKSYNMIGIMS